MNLTITEIHICRVDSSCVNQATLGSATGLSISLGSTGVKSQNVTQGSSASPSVGDLVLIVFVGSNGAMSDQNINISPDQNIDSPFTAVTAPSPNVNDSVTVAESVTLLLNPMLFNVNDTVTVTESVAMNMLVFPTVFDAVTLAEFINVNVVNMISVSDSVTVTEDVQMNLINMPNVFDGVTVAEQVVALLNRLVPEVSDTVTVTDEPTMNLLVMPSVFDSVSVAEDTIVTLTTVNNVAISVNDSVAVADEGTVLLPFIVPSVSDSVTVEDAPTTLLPFLVTSVFDSVTVAEDAVVSLTGDISISVNDAVAVADEGTVLLPFLTLQVSDDVTVAEDTSVTASGEEEQAPQGSGGRYRYYTPIPYEACKREIKEVRKDEKKIKSQIAKVRREIASKEKRSQYEFNMRVLNELIAALEKLRERLLELERQLDEAEFEEVAIMVACDERLWS